MTDTCAKCNAVQVGTILVADPDMLTQLCGTAPAEKLKDLAGKGVCMDCWQKHVLPIAFPKSWGEERRA